MKLFEIESYKAWAAAELEQQKEVEEAEVSMQEAQDYLDSITESAMDEFRRFEEELESMSKAEMESLVNTAKGARKMGNLMEKAASIASKNSNLNLQLWNLSKIYGSIFSLQIGFKSAIVISSPKLAKEVLKDHDLDVSSRPPSLGTTRLSYNGFDLIFSPCSEYWREIRKICVVHFFSSKRISGFYHIRKSEVERMLGKISEHDCVRKKIRSLYGKKPFIEDEDIEKLVYLKAVIKETLRYYAPAPLVPREFNKNSRIAGYEIEAKTIVYVNVFAIHRDPETWKDPEGFTRKASIQKTPFTAIGHNTYTEVDGTSRASTTFFSFLFIKV
ncbi:hypothetical protein AHAS_Ahas06G0277700 [Arachis hypogaea]